MNALRGDAAFVFEGKTYTFRFSGAALVALEEAFDGEAFAVVLKRIDAAGKAGGARITDVAKVVRAGLRRHHADVSLDDAADMVLDAGVQTALQQALAAAFPQGGAGDADENPPKPRARSPRGTGTKSTPAG